MVTLYLHTVLEQHLFFKIMMDYQYEVDFGISHDDSIIERMICERNNVRARVNMMVITLGAEISRNSVICDTKIYLW